jgi:tetratricopeptide (TPR) repeat protein
MTGVPKSSRPHSLRPHSGESNRDQTPWGWLFVSASVAAVLLLLTAYSNSLHNGFHFDDSHVIVDNLFIRDLANIPRFFTDAMTFSAHPANATYRPVVSLTLAVDYWLAGGLEPFWFHVTQLTLLVATGALLFLLYLKLFASTGAVAWAPWAALFGATLFCLHTGNTETANYISARSELLSGLGVLGAFAVYLYAPKLRQYHLYLLPLAIGMLAKPPAVMFAPLLLAYVLLVEEQLHVRDIFSRAAWPRVRRALMASAPAFVAGIALLVFLGVMNPPTLVYGGVGRAEYILTQTWVSVRYVGMFFVPLGLSADTDLQALRSVADVRVLAGLLLAAGTLALVWRTSSTREMRPVAFGILWFWLALVPTSVFPLAEVTNDHRVFFPFMGLTAAVVWLCASALARLPHPLRGRSAIIAAMVALPVLAAHASATRARNRVWLNEETLWADVVRKSPGNGRGLMNYGLTQMAQGRYAEAKDYFTRAFDLLPNYPALHVNLGIVTSAMGDTVGAERWFTRALELDSNYVGARMFYARWLVQQGRAPEAIPHLERALLLSPAELNARHRLLELYSATGDSRLAALAKETLEYVSSDSVALEYAATSSSRPEGSSTTWFQRGLAATRTNMHAEAAHSYRVALALDPANADAWNNLGWELSLLGFIEQATGAYERALSLNPADQRPRNNLALLRRRFPEARFRRAFALQSSGKAAEAIPIYRELLAERPGWANAHYNLGHALMSLGRCEEAVAELRKTLELQSDYPAAHLHLSTCLARLGQNEEAARHRAIYERTR